MPTTRLLGCTELVHDLVAIPLDSLIPVLSKVLVLKVWFGLPIANAICPEDLFYSVRDFHLCPVTQEPIHGSLFPDLILESIDKLLPTFKAIDIC